PFRDRVEKRTLLSDTELFDAACNRRRKQRTLQADDSRRTLKPLRARREIEHALRRWNGAAFIRLRIDARDVSKRPQVSFSPVTTSHLQRHKRRKISNILR